MPMDLATQVLQLIAAVVALAAAVIEVLSKARDKRRAKHKRSRKR